MERIKHNCPVCESGESQPFMLPWVSENDPAKLYSVASGIPGTQQLVKCLNCGMIFENPRFDAQTIIKGYMASEEGKHDSQYPIRIYSFLRALKKHSKYLPGPGAKVLDIGTAGGAFLDAAKQYGYDACGLDPSADMVARGKARGLQIEQGTLESHSFTPGSFDMICLWDVIEHLPDPKSALTEIRKLLKPEGVLLINFPDSGTWQAKLAGRRFWWILSVHLHYFTQKSIRDLCSYTGFEAISFQRYWQTLEFGYLEHRAAHFKIPLTAFIARFTPGFIQRLPISYYASQTTALARIKK